MLEKPGRERNHQKKTNYEDRFAKKMKKVKPSKRDKWENDDELYADYRGVMR